MDKEISLKMFCDGFTISVQNTSIVNKKMVCLSLELLKLISPGEERYEFIDQDELSSIIETLTMISNNAEKCEK